MIETNKHIFPLARKMEKNRIDFAAFLKHLADTGSFPSKIVEVENLPIAAKEEEPKYRDLLHVVYRVFEIE